MSAAAAYTTMAAPTVVETVAAAPVAYSAAPMMTTMAAPYAATGTVTMAAPAYTATPASVTRQVTTTAAPFTYAASLRAPVTTTMAPASIRAPVTTTLAPTMAPYAAPVTYVEPAPVTVLEAAPVTYAAPAPVTIVEAAPVTYAAPAPVVRMQTLGIAMPEIVVGPEPADLTKGIPSSQQIASQKAAYIAALDKQLADGIATIEQERSIEVKMVEFTTDKEVDLMKMQMHERKNEKIAVLDEQAALAVLELKKACVERKIQLDAQAAGLNYDYQMKFCQTELAQKNYAFQKTYAGAENKLLEEYNAQMAKANVRV